MKERGVLMFIENNSDIEVITGYESVDLYLRKYENIGFRNLSKEIKKL
jgi:hypothetical protein